MLNCLEVSSKETLFLFVHDSKEYFIETFTICTINVYKIYFDLKDVACLKLKKNLLSSRNAHILKCTNSVTNALANPTLKA